LACFIVFQQALFLFGKHVIAPVSLRVLSPRKYAERLSRFQHTFVVVLLWVLYLVHPGISLVIFQAFQCTRLANYSVLTADVNYHCNDKKHTSYVVLAVFWMCAYTIGIPCAPFISSLVRTLTPCRSVFFWWLMRHYHVSRVARKIETSGWLFEVAKLASIRGLENGHLLDESLCTEDNLSTQHLGAWCSLFVLHSTINEARQALAA